MKSTCHKTMTSKSTLLRLWPTLGIVLAVCAISASFDATAAESKKIKITATTSMVADLVEQVGGDRVTVDHLMGPGVDPHLYKTTAGDVTRLSRADVIFYSGLKLEGRMGDVFTSMANSGKKVFPVTDTIPRKKLLEPAQFEGHYDPHVWFDVEMWSECIPAIVKGLSETDPAGKAVYEKNGAALKERMLALNKWCIEKAKELPKERRILVTSHDAYNYFGRAYGFEVVAIQGVSTVTEASLSDISKMVDFIKSQKVKAIFVESSVSPTTIKRVSKDANVKIGGELFSDAMGAPGQLKENFNVGTYDGMVKYNLTTIVEALK